jgi:hypothetical protein
MGIHKIICVNGGDNFTFLYKVYSFAEVVKTLENVMSGPDFLWLKLNYGPNNIIKITWRSFPEYKRAKDFLDTPLKECTIYCPPEEIEKLESIANKYKESTFKSSISQKIMLKLDKVSRMCAKPRTFKRYLLGLDSALSRGEYTCEKFFRYSRHAWTCEERSKRC